MAGKPSVGGAQSVTFSAAPCREPEGACLAQCFACTVNPHISVQAYDAHLFLLTPGYFGSTQSWYLGTSLYMQVLTAFLDVSLTHLYLFRLSNVKTIQWST